MQNTKKENRIKRRAHIRKTVKGSAVKPRIFVFKSNRFLHTGVADDSTGIVLMGAKADRTMTGAEKLATDIAKKMKAKKLENAVFDRSGYRFHGLVAKYAETLRKDGINI